MKIVIAAGLYPPDIGGPSQYAKNLYDAFIAQGHEVIVVRYGAIKKLPTGIRHLVYSFVLFLKGHGADIIIAFDTYSVGVPAAIVSRLTGAKLLIRIGGDFLWEAYINRTKQHIPLPFFYGGKFSWNLREKIIFTMTRWELSNALLAFNSSWLRDIWTQVYGFDPDRAFVVENEYQPCAGSFPHEKKNFLFYSRKSELKNQERFRRAFQKAVHVYPDIELEEGMVTHEELMKRIQHCYAIVVPSISDVAPNYILDALRFGKPFLLTKHSGYAERFREYGVIVDPLDENDIERGIKELADSDVYEKFASRARNFKERHGYDDIAKEFLLLAQSS